MATGPERIQGNKLKRNLTRLTDARTELARTAADIGTGAAATDGLYGLADKFQAATVPAGTRSEVPVSKAGAITRGDSVTLCWELDTSGAAVRFAAEGATILTTADCTLLGLCGVIYVQDGQTKLKLFALDDAAGHEVTMSNTEVLADEVLEEAALVIDRRGAVYALYNQDGDGLIAGYATRMTWNTGDQTVESLTLTADWTDIWMDGGDPENLLAGARYLPTSFEGTADPTALCVFCTRLKEGAEDEREAALVCFQASEAACRLKTIQTAVLTPEAWDCLAGLEYAQDAYAQGWAMAVSPYRPTSWVTYPKPDESGRGVLTFTLEERMDGDDCPYLVPTPTGYADCLLAGAVPSAAMTAVVNNYVEATFVALASGITRLNTRTRAIESLLGVELWGVTADGGRVAMAAGEEGTRYNTNISRLCCCAYGTGSYYNVLMGYANEDTMYALVLTFERAGDQGDYTGGPAVALTTFDAYARLLAPKAGLAALIWQKDGAGYIKPFPVRRAVAKADPRRSDGTAMADGLTGEVIPVNLTHSD